MTLVPFDQNIEALVKEEEARLARFESVFDVKKNVQWLLTRYLQPAKNVDILEYSDEALTYLSSCFEKKEAIPLPKEKLAQIMAARERSHRTIAALIAYTRTLDDVPPLC